MAGEDPGVGVITLILDLIRRGWDAVTGVTKSFVGGIMDITKTALFFSWRRKMMQGQKVPDLKHGEQSLKDLRLHEQVGAKIVTVEIGDGTAMEALREELRRLELDFAITEHEGRYTLHYKESNEQDVLYAQQVALEKLYGNHEQDGPEQETPDDPDGREEQDREERQDDDRDREQDQRDDDRENDDEHREGRQDDRGRDEQSDQDDRSQDESRQNEQDAHDEQERQNQQEQQGREGLDDGRRDEPTPVPIPVPVEVGEKSPSDKASRGKHARQATPVFAEKEPSAPPRTQRSAEAPSLAERMPPPPSQSQRVPQTHAQTKDTPQFEPLESLIAKARERAAAKNAARRQNHSLDRNHNRVRAREVNFGH